MFKAIGIGPYVDDSDELAVKLLPVGEQGEQEKVAATLGKYVPDEILTFCKSVKPDPNCVYLHIIAMTASDHFGPNRNGDHFSEADLIGTQDNIEAAKNMAPWTGKPVQRFKTFLQASFYHHHRNKPHLGHDRFGTVVIAAYNHPMHRVELVIKVYRKDTEVDGIKYLGDPQTCERAEKGLPIAFSMGTKVPGEYCSITNEFYKTVADRGYYLKNFLGKILPDGRRVYAINRKPRFFDISKVVIPADPLGYSLQKVASEGGEECISSAELAVQFGMVEESFEQKIAAFGKKATIEKDVPDGKLIGTIADEHPLPPMIDHEEKLPSHVLAQLGNLPLSKAVAQTTAAGIKLKPEELGDLVVIRLKQSPDVTKEAATVDWDAGIDYDIASELYKFASKRSYIGTRHVDRLEKIAAKSDADLKNDKSLASRIYKKFNQRLPAGVTVGAFLALLYKSYEKSLREGSFKQFLGMLERNPMIMPLLIGSGTIGAAAIESALEKKASITERKLLQMAGATAAPYLTSGYVREREMEGRQPGRIGKFVRDNPGLVAMGGIAAGPGGGARAIKRLLTKKASVDDPIDGLKKLAGLSKMDLIDSMVIGPMTTLTGNIPTAMTGGLIDNYVLNKVLGSGSATKQNKVPNTKRA